MIARDGNGKAKFDPIGLIRLAIEIAVILITISIYLSGITSQSAIQATEIKNLQTCDIRLEKKIDDNKVEREAQLNKIESKLDKYTTC
jgi:hypothetical protein